MDVTFTHDLHPAKTIARAHREKEEREGGGRNGRREGGRDGGREERQTDRQSSHSSAA